MSGVRFQTMAEASAFLAPRLDRPVEVAEERLGDGVVLRRDALPLPGGAFTNRYRLSWHPPRGRLRILAQRTATPDYAAAHPHHAAVSTGGFFFLADDCDLAPRCLSLNLAVEDGRVCSLPVADQEALVSSGGAMAVRTVAARGGLRLDGAALSWAGARTEHPADCRVYGNACLVILHVTDPETGKRRVFQEPSRYTPPAPAGAINLGLRRVQGADFVVAQADGGPLDLLRHDAVLCAPTGAVGAPARIEHIDGADLSGLSAISVGPSLHCADLAAHPLNADRSLGSTPLLLGRPSSRLVFYTTPDGGEHLCLLDGRPGSAVFPGVTLRQTLDLVHADAEVVTGCFLDSGQTPRLSLRQGAERVSYGNRHYLRWPTAADPTFLWTPDRGRPTASVITVG